GGEGVGREGMLAREGTLVVKFWLHLSPDVQKKRLRKLEADPRTRWRVTRADWEVLGRHQEHRRLSEQLIRRTSTAEGPWVIVEGTHRRYRDLTVARTLLEALRARLERPRVEPPAPQPLKLTPAPVNVI